MRWNPHVTVAAIIERDNRFLMVKEEVEGNIVYNQPAGHLEASESLIDAIIREVREETAWQFQPAAVTGIYRMHLDNLDITYLRTCFTGELGHYHDNQTLDEGIIEATWMTRDEIAANSASLRSPLVMRCIDDYLAGTRFPLDVLKDIGNV